MLQATGYSFISGLVVSNCGLFGPRNFFKGKVNMYMGCQDHYRVKASVIFIFNILFVSLYIFMYKFYKTQAYCLFLNKTTDFSTLWWWAEDEEILTSTLQKLA